MLGWDTHDELLNPSDSGPRRQLRRFIPSEWAEMFQTPRSKLTKSAHRRPARLPCVGVSGRGDASAGGCDPDGSQFSLPAFTSSIGLAALKENEPQGHRRVHADDRRAPGAARPSGQAPTRAGWGILCGASTLPDRHPDHGGFGADRGRIRPMSGMRAPRGARSASGINPLPDRMMRPIPSPARWRT